MIYNLKLQKLNFMITNLFIVFKGAFFSDSIARHEQKGKIEDSLKIKAVTFLEQPQQVPKA